MPPTRLRIGASSPEIELQCEAIENHKMKTRCFDHIDLRVKNMAVAGKFYGKFLPQLGFVQERPGDNYPYFLFRRRRQAVGILWLLTRTRIISQIGTRIAFWADTREEVDRLAKLVREAGGKSLEGPEICRGYSPGYYAFFFEDPDGNKLEICCRERPIIAG